MSIDTSHLTDVGMQHLQALIDVHYKLQTHVHYTTLLLQRGVVNDYNSSIVALTIMLDTATNIIQLWQDNDRYDKDVMRAITLMVTSINRLDFIDKNMYENICNSQLN